MTHKQTPPESMMAPADMDDETLERTAQAVFKQLQEVEVQLGQPRRYRADGTEYKAVEYHDWRRQAKFAKQSILVRYRTLKAELLRRRSEVARAHDGGHDPNPLIERIDTTNALLLRIVQLLEQDYAEEHS